MEMTARLTGDAKISTLKNDRQVVNFSVAINDSYKAKGSDERISFLFRPVKNIHRILTMQILSACS